ncbi:sigma factor [Paucisalibacillus sp. EB02]|uniref:sigma factor n=1 Tax=Paucisalibacillus sp. EB02 TaxID=1347087 RepID=UPI0004AF1B2C|nr:sigma factor [Paucisalibacillus sp. EB02]
MSIFKSNNKRIDEQTFETLVVSEQKKLYRIAYTYVKNEQTALDIVQETIIKAYKAFHKLSIFYLDNKNSNQYLPRLYKTFY